MREEILFLALPMRLEHLSIFAYNIFFHKKEKYSHLCDYCLELPPFLLSAPLASSVIHTPGLRPDALWLQPGGLNWIVFLHLYFLNWWITLSVWNASSLFCLGSYYWSSESFSKVTTDALTKLSGESSYSFFWVPAVAPGPFSGLL